MKKESFFKRNSKDTSTYTVAFYNLENLFDTKDDKRTLDDDFLPNSEKKWTPKKYESKLFKLGKAISNVGFDKTRRPPSIIGLAEVENKNVVTDLIESKHLKNKNYGVVHYDSPDERGIDTALIYQKDTFEVKDTKTIPLLLFNEFGERDYTRDVLHVTGELNKERIHVLVNHWPSRRSGANETSDKRIAAAQNVKQVVEGIQNQEEDPGILIMGDFNDDPHSESIKNHLLTSTLINPMEQLMGQDRGSLNYRKQWNLFDQIILSHNFLKMERGTHHFAHADIFDERFLAEWKGSYKGNPFRTYVGKKYLGGYSDHFPVYVQLKYTRAD
ncbi:endonuclease [Ascidiimonas sp. W6]|uniref:endonuclease/exonuclease/phosphatase family protein n=1 Tax=Ascidiimonas meishanensis TaxID=3128903 RepID=UPI0030EB7535